MSCAASFSTARRRALRLRRAWKEVRLDRSGHRWRGIGGVWHHEPLDQRAGDGHPFSADGSRNLAVNADGVYNPAGYHGPSATNSMISGAVSGLAGGGVRSLITGTSFGDNILAVLPDVIGNVVGTSARGQQPAWSNAPWPRQRRSRVRMRLW